MSITPQQIADLIVYAKSEELPVLTKEQDEAVDRIREMLQPIGKRFTSEEDAAISLLGQALAQLQSQVSAQDTLLKARELALAQASKDSERLDWLAEHVPHLQKALGESAADYRNQVVIFGYVYAGPNIRDAIDMAQIDNAKETK